MPAVAADSTFSRPHALRPVRRRPLGPVARWILPALLLTLAVHAALYGIVRAARLHALSPAFYDKIVPPAFKIRQVEIDPKLLDPGNAQPQSLDKVPTTPEPKPTDIQIPGEKPTFDQLMARANEVIAAPKVTDQTVAVDKPRVDSSAESVSRVLHEGNTNELPSDLNALTSELLARKPNVTRSHPSFNVNGPEDTTRANGGPNVGPANFSNLDGLLSQRGPLTGKEGPILLPTDLLYDYDSSILRPDAANSLAKLGQLIRQNPQATFIIDGHTDSFGSPTYNQTLSERRAASVKEWLAREAGIDPARIQTRGWGSRRPLVTGGDVAAQQLNRRVEIVIRTNRNTGR